MEEIFKKIPEFPDYEISNTGKCRNINTGRILKDRSCNNYIMYSLSYTDENGKRKQISKYKHIILAQLFIPNPHNLPIVDHINTNKINNNLDNLRWVTISQNNRNRAVNNPHGYRGITFNKRRKKWYSQISINNSCYKIGQYSTKEEAAQAFNKYVIDNNLEEFIDLNVII